MRLGRAFRRFVALQPAAGPLSVLRFGVPPLPSRMLALCPFGHYNVRHRMSRSKCGSWLPLSRATGHLDGASPRRSPSERSTALTEHYLAALLSNEFEIIGKVGDFRQAGRGKWRGQKKAFNGQAPFFAFADLVFDPLSANPTREPNLFADPYGAAGQANPFPSKPRRRTLTSPRRAFFQLAAAAFTTSILTCAHRTSISTTSASSAKCFVT